MMGKNYMYIYWNKWSEDALFRCENYTKSWDRFVEQTRRVWDAIPEYEAVLEADRVLFGKVRSWLNTQEQFIDWIEIEESR